MSNYARGLRRLGFAATAGLAVAVAGGNKAQAQTPETCKQSVGPVYAKLRDDGAFMLQPTISVKCASWTKIKDIVAGSAYIAEGAKNATIARDPVTVPIMTSVVFLKILQEVCGGRRDIITASPLSPHMIATETGKLCPALPKTPTANPANAGVSAQLLP